MKIHLDYILQTNKDAKIRTIVNGSPFEKIWVSVFNKISTTRLLQMWDSSNANFFPGESLYSCRSQNVVTKAGNENINRKLASNIGSRHMIWVLFL